MKKEAIQAHHPSVSSVCRHERARGLGSDQKFLESPSTPPHTDSMTLLLKKLQERLPNDWSRPSLFFRRGHPFQIQRKVSRSKSLRFEAVRCCLCSCGQARRLGFVESSRVTQRESAQTSTPVSQRIHPPLSSRTVVLQLHCHKYFYNPIGDCASESRLID